MGACAKKISRANALLERLRALPADPRRFLAFVNRFVGVADSAFGLFLPRLGPHVWGDGSPPLPCHAEKRTLVKVVTVVTIVDVQCTKSPNFDAQLIRARAIDRFLACEGSRQRGAVFGRSIRRGRLRPAGLRRYKSWSEGFLILDITPANADSML